VTAGGAVLPAMLADDLTFDERLAEETLNDFLFEERREEHAAERADF
jgi:hypothetical protein